MVANLRVGLGALEFKPDKVNALSIVLLSFANKSSRDLQIMAVIAGVRSCAQLRDGGC